ncbi:hypothetical protein E2C01_059731 [Portunus trituberculatus]|uniref:Uncharacterized protein n=1 Tax=Portunus trituberculatus TaxID=210409 RepID=A0A5B7H659_PORTR|nr:hypothetical protein [Portunus trituberculatus]
MVPCERSMLPRLYQNSYTTPPYSSSLPPSSLYMLLRLVPYLVTYPSAEHIHHSYMQPVFTKFCHNTSGCLTRRENMSCKQKRRLKYLNHHRSDPQHTAANANSAHQASHG